MDKTLSTPDVSTVQWGTIVGAACALAAAFGLNISQDKQDAIVLFVTVFAPVLVAADAHIRHGRARAMIHAPKPIEPEPAVTVKKKPAPRG